VIWLKFWSDDMFHHRTLLMAGLAALTAPGIAHADEVFHKVNVGAEVNAACGIGNPNDDVIDLNDLTGPDGALASSLTSPNESGFTVIPDAWCNTPHKVTIDATPMRLEPEYWPSYAQPSYMAREIAYDAKLIGWPSTFGKRAVGGGDPAFTEVDYAYAPASGLKLSISRLQTLTAGRAEQPNLMLEVGPYLGTVTITLATNP
jgi:hypothetical protein